MDRYLNCNYSYPQINLLGFSKAVKTVQEKDKTAVEKENKFEVNNFNYVSLHSKFTQDT